MATATALRSDLRPTARELRWFQHIARHGPQSSEFLFEATRDTHHCKDTALRRLQALREAGYLRLPPQQRQIAKAEFNPYVYDLTGQGEDCLKARGVWQNELRPTGHWWHGFWVSSVTSAIEIMARRSGMEFVPGRKILELRGASLAIPLPKSKLVPDQLFALKGRDGYRAYALEVDRGTEPIRSTADRKSLARSLEQYCAVLGDGAARAHYGLKAPILVIWVFKGLIRSRFFEEIRGVLPVQTSSSVLTLSADCDFPNWCESAQMVNQLHQVNRRTSTSNMPVTA